MQLLILRLDAPLVSFGAPIVDNYGKVQAFPALSMLVGLVGNALGYDHADHENLQRLQERLRYAARCDRPGKPLRDYQTVDLGQSFMLGDEVGWTTRGRIDGRQGAPDTKTGTHIRYRDYRADSIHTVAFGIVPPDENPTLDDLEHALRSPERPLFIGRKCCLPSSQLLVGRVQAAQPIAALRTWPRLPVHRSEVPDDQGLPAWWTEGEGEHDDKTTRQVPVTDERDWRNQLHGGQRMLRHGLIAPPRGDA